MKVTIFSLVLIVSFLLISEVSLSLKPFSIQLPYWHRGLGLFLVAIGFLVYNIGEQTKGYIDGLREGSEITIEALKELSKPKNHS